MSSLLSKIKKLDNELSLKAFGYRPLKDERWYYLNRMVLGFGLPLFISIVVALLTSWRFIFSCLVFSLILGVLNELVLKKFFKRSRPGFSGKHTTFGMPSSHGLFAGFVIGQLLLSPYSYKGAIVPATVLLLLIPYSRVVDGSHYLSDVTIGTFIGVGFALLIGFAPLL